MNQNERICHEKTPQGIQAALDALVMRKPALSSLVYSFGPVLVAKAELTARLSENEVKETDLPEFDWVRFSKGVQLFAITGLMDFHKEFKQAAQMILPPIAAAFPGIRSDIESIKNNIADNNLDAGECVQAVMANSTRIIKALAARANTTPDILRFALAQISGPFKEIQARAFAPLVEEHKWLHGHCPMCGSFPVAAGLIGEEGDRWLQCSVCAHEWRFNRHICPRCENNDQTLLECFSDQDSPVNDGEQVNVCKLCNTYLLTIDLRRHIDPVNMDVAVMGMNGLDLQAREKGYSPQAETLWHLMER
ncbi:formate dehydrogenase accessory protein FdhE [Desulfobacter latus]|uniref:Formate dehydrogenase accessory protein FdhE n=1 Tax=Desulfobacter latus TaxID=2292 RepID=A0A850T1H4_9BACT|nr:formate dehydrogenase accessory protein FdhE [Desulfobacter latus]NWH05563.1 formate dehydrogenase accessory protein FdhE [Desulfobacter latus]